nr:zinc ribbon domain-containing protein [Halobacterium sp. CBA1126]
MRRWVRAVSWFLLALATAALVVPESAYQAFQNEGFAGLVAASESFGVEVTLSLLVIRVLNVVDAYLVAVRDTASKVTEHVPTPGDADVDAVGGDDAGTCPECGKELDGDLDFCPWCTTRLEDAEATSR